MSTIRPTPAPGPRPWPSGRPTRRRARAGAAQAKTRHNWALYAFLFLLPLQNIQTGYMPNLGGGLNFLNLGFGLSLIGAWILRGRIAPNEPVNRWVVVYALYAVLSLFVSYHYVSNTETHFNILKDHLHRHVAAVPGADERQATGPRCGASCWSRCCRCRTSPRSPSTST